MSSPEQRGEWRTIAAFLARLRLAEGEPLPVAQVEELANAVLALLDEVERLRVSPNAQEPPAAYAVAPEDEREDFGAELGRLRREVQGLRAELNQARAWAWSEFHREYDGRWLKTVVSPDLEGGWDYDPPRWLIDPRSPVEQEWWTEPREGDRE